MRESVRVIVHIFWLRRVCDKEQGVYVNAYKKECVCVCVCVCERERERE